MKPSFILSIFILTSFSFCTNEKIKNDDKKFFSKKNAIPNTKQLSGLWSVNCSPAERNIDIKESSVVISMETNQYYITLKELKREKNKIYYQYEKMSGLGAQDYDSPAYLNSETVCTIEIVNDGLLKFSWLGLFDKELKERFEKENPFNQYEKIVSLKKCSD
ncbi:hypothetical protein [Chryseobacterium jejuense]|uniref:DUF4488 domain-containing protein n=1 Tax=Chryseobacterium jejuense TaxID=445960 RepID=A0A2X2XQ25_CHRJE|nr:hypothetical protein [Chryseobacterium jejuense]SDJ20900.1 hypothetical protein SAMN05421542_3024 [Chryseobacterium jejuense]SQB28530.1 Uncharacterised protein [Chryseobacterium jejuense]